MYTGVLLDVYARGVPGGRTGSVTVMQRASSGLNANLHFHTLVLDGVFSDGAGGELVFHPAAAPGPPRGGTGAAARRRARHGGRDVARAAAGALGGLTEL